MVSSHGSSSSSDGGGAKISSSEKEASITQTLTAIWGALLANVYILTIRATLFRARLCCSINACIYYCPLPAVWVKKKNTGWESFIDLLQVDLRKKNMYNKLDHTLIENLKNWTMHFKQFSRRVKSKTKKKLFKKKNNNCQNFFSFSNKMKWKSFPEHRSDLCMYLSLDLSSLITSNNTTLLLCLVFSNWTFLYT